MNYWMIESGLNFMHISCEMPINSCKTINPTKDWWIRSTCKCGFFFLQKIDSSLSNSHQCYTMAINSMKSPHRQPQCVTTTLLLLWTAAISFFIMTIHLNASMYLTFQVHSLAQRATYDNITVKLYWISALLICIRFDRHNLLYIQSTWLYAQTVESFFHVLHDIISENFRNKSF